MTSGPLRELLSRWETMKSRRSQFEIVWQEIQDLMSPFRGDITTKRGAGQKRIGAVFDTTAMQSADQFVNFLKGAMFPSTRDWMGMFPPEGLENDLELKEILDAITSRFMRSLNGSNFYLQTPQAIRDFSVIGNTAILVQEDRDPRSSRFGGLLFEAIPMSRIWWFVGRGNRVQMVVREMEMGAVDAWRHFGRGQTIMRALDKGFMEPVNILHMVYRNENDVPGGVPAETQLPWVSKFVAIDSGGRPEELEEAGFPWNPYIVSRWDIVDGEEYGRGRGNLVRSDAKGVNELKRQVLIAAGRDLNPILAVEHEAVLQLDAGPSGIAVTRIGRNPPEFLSSNTNYQVADEIGRQDRQMIRSGFLGDVLGEPETEPRSAAESRARQARALARLAAPADRIQNEFLTPLIDTALKIMVEAGAIPEWNDLIRFAQSRGLSDVDVELQFSGPLFTAQKAEVLLNLQEFVNLRIDRAVATGDPTWIDRIDPDAVTRLEAEISDVPAEIFRSDEDLERIREQRAQARRIEQQRQTIEAAGRAGILDGRS